MNKHYHSSGHLCGADESEAHFHRLEGKCEARSLLNVVKLVVFH